MPNLRGFSLLHLVLQRLKNLKIFKNFENCTHFSFNISKTRTATNFKLSHHVANEMGQIWCKNQKSAVVGKEVTVHQKRPILSTFGGQYMCYLWLKKVDFSRVC